jgi:hypothetical protein
LVPHPARNGRNGRNWAAAIIRRAVVIKPVIVSALTDWLAVYNGHHGTVDNGHRGTSYSLRVRTA